MNRTPRATAHSSTNKQRIDAIADEARDMGGTRKRRYLAARCAGYGPDQALIFANVDGRESDEVTISQRDRVAAVRS